MTFVASPSKANTPQCTALVSAGDKFATDDLKRSENAVRQQVLQCNGTRSWLMAAIANGSLVTACVAQPVH